MEESARNLEKRFDETSRAHQEILGQLQNDSFNQLQQTRLDYSRKLAAYSERQSDPFYRMMDMHAELTDEGNRYVLTAKIPEHEQHALSIAVRGNQIVISGTRRAEEHVELDAGHERGTNSYQSFMESFPFAHPVEAGLLTKQFDGDRVTINLPKKTLQTEYRPFKAKPKKIEVQRPQYPPNLPHVQDETTISGEAPGHRGSGTLEKT